jgi:hypothetical protein
VLYGSKNSENENEIPGEQIAETATHNTLMNVAA